VPSYFAWDRNQSDAPFPNEVVLDNFYPFLIYVVVTTFTPGPNNIMSMTNAMHFGYGRSLKFLAGVSAGFLIVMFASGILNVVLTDWLPFLENWLKILGAIYMFYLAIHIARSKPLEVDEGKNGDNTFVAGFTMQFLNIKVILYGITVYSLFIIHSYQTPGMIGLFALALAMVGFIANSCWAFGGNVFRSTLRKNYRWFNFAMAGLLVYTAVASLL
jgi:cysteine/O-acetylserine efflux protein